MSLAFSLRVVSFAVMMTACSSGALAAGNIAGHVRYEKIKGRPHMGYFELYESDLFIVPATQATIGVSRRLGTSCYSGGLCSENIITSDGCYCRDGLPAGTYSLLVDQPDFYACPKVLPNVNIINGQTVTYDVEMPTDYTMTVLGSWTGGDHIWYQTFVATGTSIRGVAAHIAGVDGTNRTAEVAILRDNGNADVRDWQVVGSRFSEKLVVNTTPSPDSWVRWRSGEIPTTPGVRYAVRYRGLDADHQGQIDFQPYKRSKDSNSYLGGQAYNSSGVAQNFDLAYVVFCDNDETVVTMNKRNSGLGFLCDGSWSTAWGQTFVARGDGVAGVDCWAAGDNKRWDLNFRWRIREDGPTGPQVGPTKITFAAWAGAGYGLHGVSYNPGEVPVAHGHTYFVEFQIYNPPSDSNGFNPCMMQIPPGASCDGDSASDSFDEGMAYRWNGTSWTAKPDADVAMTIIEYAIPGIELNKSSIMRTVYKGEELTPDTFTVRNSGVKTLEYAISDGSVTWLSQSPTDGTATTETDTIQILYPGVSSLPKGTYQAVISVSGNAVNSPQAITVTVNVVTVKPDFDGDWDVDQEDVGHLQQCLTGPGVTQSLEECLDARLDGDDDVDTHDYGLLQRCMSGADVPAFRTCAGE